MPKKPLLPGLDWETPLASHRKIEAERWLTDNPNPTPAQIEALANYLLWGEHQTDGDTPETARNPIKSGFIIQPSTSTPWKRANYAIPISALGEAADIALDTAAPFWKRSSAQRTRRQTFSRETATARLEARGTPAALAALEALRSLWVRMDALQARITFEDEWHLDPTFRPYVARRELVALRQEQYNYAHIWEEPVRPHSWHPATTSAPASDPTFLDFSEIAAFPFPSQPAAPFQPSPTVLRFASHWAATRHDLNADDPSFLDLTDPAIWPNLIAHFDELRLLFPNLATTMEFLMAHTPLKPHLTLVLRGKLASHAASLISEAIAASGNHNKYSPNYISTLYHNQVLPALAQSAATLQLALLALASPDPASHFKQCGICHEWKLRSIDYNARSRMADGLEPNCRACGKALYQKFASAKRKETP